MKNLSIILMMAFSIMALAQDRNFPPLPESGNVTLPLDEYNKLIELAKKPARKPEEPPIPYVIKRADLKLRVTSDSVLGTIQFDGEVFIKGAAKVPLVNALTVLDARQAGKALPLVQESGAHAAVLLGPAEFSLTLDAGMPLNVDAGRASFSLPVPMAGSSQLSLEIPGEYTNVKIDPGLITRRSTENGRTVIEATLASGQSTSVWWTTREIAAPATPREVRFLTDVKTLVSVSETDIKLAALTDVTIVQGEPAQFEVEIPPGYEMTGVTGASLESEEMQSGRLILKINGTAKRSHQFLISLEKPISENKADIVLPSFKGSQRETGEVLVEGVGTMELNATGIGALKRMDLKETNNYLRSLAQNPLHAVFRYHRQTGEPPKLALAWNRFPDSSVLAAAAEQAEVTTLITSEGRSLTEVKLTVKNQAQPFLKVGLPAGASILSADVSGEKVKPVQGADGIRVPLLRTGFRPSGPYQITFVFMHEGAPFAKKGDSDLNLPKMDIPINLLQWEVFIPEIYKVKDFGGDAIAASLLPPGSPIREEDNRSAAGSGGGNIKFRELLTGQIGGIVVDATQAVLSGATVTVTNTEKGLTRTTYTDNSGQWIISNMPSGNISISAESSGFQKTIRTNIPYNANNPSRINMELMISLMTQQIEVSTTANDIRRDSQRIEREVKKSGVQSDSLIISNNVVNFQRRVAGVLPIRVDVPRTGNSYRFLRPLVLDEETKVTFHYKSK